MKLSRLLGPITLCEDLRLRWGLKKSCSPHQELSNGMWHATYTQVSQGDSWVLVVGNQFDNLTPDPSFGHLTLGPFFGHNLCFIHLNGSCQPILDIYDLKVFQRYKEILNPMDFDPWNRSLKVREFIGTQTPKVGTHLGVRWFIPSHFVTLPRAWDVIPRFLFWPASLQALALVVSPRLRLRQCRYL